MNIATCHIVDINHMHTPLKPVIGYILILKAWGRYLISVPADTGERGAECVFTSLVFFI
jgi:hypothetical protein